MHFLTPLLHPKIRIIWLLGFASGLPYLLVGGTLGVWLRESGMDLSTVGMFAWVAIPYSFNFIWAPLVDQLKLPYLTRRLGRRRSWMLLSQLLLMAALIALSQTDPQLSLPLMAGLALFAAFCSATHDIVVDAFRAEYLDKAQYGDGSAMVVFGYRIGVLAAGAGALALADIDGISWPMVYGLMAGLMLVGVVTCLCICEPNPPALAAQDKTKGWLRRAIAEPFIQFARQHKGWPLILLLIFSYRLPDGFIGFISYSFYVDMGFSKSEIASLVKLFGLIATLVGALAGAALMRRFSLHRCLTYFLLFQMAANLAYIGFEFAGPSRLYLMMAISLDNLSAGMITAAAITYMMQLCDLRYTATQYALLSSLASLASKTLAGGAGFVAESYGYSAMFAFSAALGLPALLILLYMPPLRPPGLRDGPNASGD